MIFDVKFIEKDKKNPLVYHKSINSSILMTRMKPGESQPISDEENAKQVCKEILEKELNVDLSDCKTLVTVMPDQQELVEHAREFQRLRQKGYDQFLTYARDLNQMKINPNDFPDIHIEEKGWFQKFKERIMNFASKFI